MLQHVALASAGGRRSSGPRRGCRAAGGGRGVSACRRLLLRLLHRLLRRLLHRLLRRLRLLLCPCCAVRQAVVNHASEFCGQYRAHCEGSQPAVSASKSPAGGSVDGS